VVGP